MGTRGTGWPSMDGEDDTQDTSAEIDPEIQRITDQLNGRMWGQGAQQPAAQEPDQPEWWSQSPEEFLSDPQNEALDFHNDPEALDAVLPKAPELPWYQDQSHPQHQSRSASLLRILGSAAIGGLAGRGGQEQMIAQSHGMRSGGIGTGFQYGLAAGQQLQNLVLQRQAMKDKSDYQRAQIARMQTQTAALPQKEADLSKYRRARTGYLDAQTSKIAESLKRAPKDKVIHSYNADDGKVHFLYQKPDGSTYEKASDQGFYTAPEKPAAIARPIVGHGHDGIYLIDPSTFKAHKVVSYPQNAQRHAPESYFRAAQNWKDKEWRKIQNDSLLSDDEKMNRLQQVEDHFGSVVQTGGGGYTPYDVRSGTSAGSAPPSTPGNGSNEVHYKIQNGQLVPE
jgi:hypothetical protein